MTGEGGTEVESSGLVNTLQGHVNDIRTLIQCGICIRPLYEPYTLACGHTFCYSCLASWFAGGRSKRTCPDCRAPVKSQPAPAYLVRAIVQMFTSRAELLDKEESTAEHLKNHQEESERLDKDKASTDPVTGGLFGGLFKPPQPKPVIDDDDGVTRCPLCSWELEDGLNCHGCGYIYRQDSEGTDYSESDISESELGSRIEGDSDGEDDFDDRSPQRREPSPRPFPPRGPFDPNVDYSDFLFGGAFPSGMTGGFTPQMFWQVHPRSSTFNSWSYPQRDVYDDDEEEEEEGEEMDEEEEEEEVDEDEDEYGGSFIDDEAEVDHEGEESQSDHSTVVGNTRVYNQPFPRIPPLVRYPHVHGPSSVPGAGYDWRRHRQQAPNHGGVRHTVPSSSIYGFGPEEDETHGGGHRDITSSSPYGHDEIEDVDEDEDSDVPHTGNGYRHRPLRAPYVPEDEESEDECSSSPPRARPPIARIPRDTGASARTAITIDDSDEEPVGPVRRGAQRRQVRFSPY